MILTEAGTFVAGMVIGFLLSTIGLLALMFTIIYKAGFVREEKNNGK